MTLGCDLPAAGGAVRVGPGAAAAERWDGVPAVSDGYAAARDALLPRLEALLARIAAAR